MAKIGIEINCCLCSEKYETSIEAPDGWVTRYGIDVENGFCPAHHPVAAFADAQCAGCVGGWGDCDMWQAFAFSHSRVGPIMPDDLEVLRRGVCPRRTNGTFSFSHDTGMKKEDISEQAPDTAGSAFADAIEAYRHRYFSRKEST